jgi:hypothetical protein
VLLSDPLNAIPPTGKIKPCYGTSVINKHTLNKA